MRKTLGLTRRSVALTVPLNTYIGEVAAERGVVPAEVIRDALIEWKERREKLIPRQGRQRSTPLAQTRMPLGVGAD